jgi:hypothetical protein
MTAAPSSVPLDPEGAPTSVPLDPEGEQEGPDSPGLNLLGPFEAVNTIFGFVTSTDILLAPVHIINDLSESQPEELEMG